MDCQFYCVRDARFFTKLSQKCLCCFIPAAVASTIIVNLGAVLVPSTWGWGMLVKFFRKILLGFCLSLRVWLLSCFGRVRLFETPRTVACQESLSLTIFQSLLKLMSVELVMPNTHLILYCPFLLLPSIFPSITVFSNDGKVWWSSLVKCIWSDVLGKCVFGIV